MAAKRSIYDNLGGRRFLFTCFCELSGTVALVVGKLDAANYVTLTLGLAAVFVAGATTQHIKGVP